MEAPGPGMVRLPAPAALRPREGGAHGEEGAGRGRNASGSGPFFDKLARRYDLLNRLISLGLDRRWRRRLVASLALGGDARVLDLATGTADVALDIAGRHPGARVWGVDPSGGMLAVGAGKIAARSLRRRVRLVAGRAEALPFPGEIFDGVCIAFGIRNVPDRPAALAEMLRVLRPGGRLAVLELGEPAGGVLAPLARFHVHRIVPLLGGLLSGRAEYRYLRDSIGAFPAPEEFATMLRAAGAATVRVDRLSFGAAHIYVGVRR